MPNWDDITLFDPDTLTVLEPVMMDGLTVSDDLQDEVKDHFAADLLRRFASVQALGEADSDTFNLLDHLSNPDVLSRAARLYCLYLLFYGQRVGDTGEYTDKSRAYYKRYELALEDAYTALEFDDYVNNLGAQYGEVRLVN